MYKQDTKEIIGRIRGLSEREVYKSKELYGDNQLVKYKKGGFFSEFVSNFGDPIIKILLIALAVNIAIRLRDFNWYESIGIAVAILVSTFVSTLSEYGSESAFEKLQSDALKTKCRVKRADGLMEIPVSDVVVGDYVMLQAGDRIPADGVIISGELYVDQSTINGESKEAYKTSGQTTSPDSGGEDFNNKRKLFRGCIVCSGEAVMLVEKVGAKTFYGSIARDIQEESGESPLKIRLGELAKAISRFGYIGAGLVAFADLFQSIVLANSFRLDLITRCLSTPKQIGGYLIHAATLAISVIVVAIPEGLPLMITVVLSSNMKRMLKDNVLVRKLVGIETSGNINILFTDKTGTITKGRLKVSTFVTGCGKKYDSFAAIQKKRLGELLRISSVYNSGATMSYKNKRASAIGGNTTERALLEFVSVNQGTAEKIKVLKSLPFSSANKYSCSEISGDINLTLIKGAPELLLPCCSFFYDEDGNKIQFTSYKLKAVMNEMASNAVRLLAVAVSEKPMGNGFNNDLTLVGIIGIKDEVRHEAVKAIKQVAGAGIQVVMITGDNKETAAAIAREVGLINNSKKDDWLITSDELKRMSDSEIKARLPHLRVVARAVPSDKSRLVNIAQQLGLVAGMTGDGINDAPALKKADVGFAMGSGTEVAKESSDIVILDDNFLSISKAILYGRTIFKSIRKFIIFQLTINVCAVGISILGPFIGINSPITVLQMLWVNMVMDTLAGLAFAGEAPLKEYMDEQPKRRDEPIINSYMYNQILVSGFYVMILCVMFLKLPIFRAMYDHGTGNEYFMTAFFAMFIFAGVFNSFNARTTRLNLLAHIIRNKGFIVIMIFVTLVQLIIIYFGGSIFRTTGLTVPELQFVILLAFTVIPVDIVRKIFSGISWRGDAI